MASAPIETKVAAGGVGAFAATLTIGLLDRYTSYHPSPDEVGAIVGLFGFAVAWAVPSRVRDRFGGEASRAEVNAAASEPHEGA